jgi:hypothetical protein
MPVSVGGRVYAVNGPVGIWPNLIYNLTLQGAPLKLCLGGAFGSI